MKRPNPEDYRDKNYADLFYWEEYCRECEKYIDHVESQNKKLIEREQRIRKFWDVAPDDFNVIANGKGTLECGTKINNK